MSAFCICGTRGLGQNLSYLDVGRFGTDLSHACVVVSYDKSYEGRSQRARRESGQEPHFEEWCVYVCMSGKASWRKFYLSGD